MRYEDFGRVYKVPTFNTDDHTDISYLKQINFKPGLVPRPFEYDSWDARVVYGLTPADAFPEHLFPLDEAQERLEEAHALKRLPMYHALATWTPDGFRYSQNGLGYCWTWGGTASFLTMRGIEDYPTVMLAPVSMGYLVNWANQGNWLGSWIKGAREDGIAPVPEGYDVNMLNRSASFWRQYDKLRYNYRLGGTWDCDPRRMQQHCVNGLYLCRSGGYVAYSWWGHALCLLGIEIVDGQWKWLLRNSHNEPSLIVLTGSRAIPDECYFFLNSEPV